MTAERSQSFSSVSVINEDGTFDFYQEYMPWHYDIVLEGFEKNFEFLSGGGK